MTKNDLFTKQILEELDQIKGSGVFYCESSLPEIPMGLVHAEYGEIPLPILPVIAEQLLPYSRQAPYGKGQDTITDTSVRNSFEIEGSKLYFANPAWHDTLDKIVKMVQEGLGLDEYQIAAKLDKMLVYETGGFFLEHQDTERGEGMFGSLVIGLPCSYSGGELRVSYKDHVHQSDFTAELTNYRTPFIAFYSDCRHEILPVTDGFRATLIYHLYQKDKHSTISPPAPEQQIENIAAVLNANKSLFNTGLKAILLGHQYTPKNFSADKLKRHDRPRASAIIQAAQRAGFEAQLALVTHYQTGIPKDHYFAEEDGWSASDVMDEVIDEEISIVHWLESSPYIGTILPLSTEQIIGTDGYGSDGPIDKDYEGYMGNYGPSIDYWYHYGAVVLWPKANTIDIFDELGFTTYLSMLSRWSDDLHAMKATYTSQDIRDILVKAQHKREERVPKIAFRLSNEDVWMGRGVCRMVSLMNDKELAEQMIDLLVHVFNVTPTDDLLDLFATYPSIVQPMVQSVTSTDAPSPIHHLITLLLESNSRGTPELGSTIHDAVSLLPVAIERTLRNVYRNTGPADRRTDHSIIIPKKNYDAKDFASYVTDILTVFSRHGEQALVDDIYKTLCSNDRRLFVNKVLIPAIESYLRDEDVLDGLVRRLAIYCAEHLEVRVNTKHLPPTDWTRAIPEANYDKGVWTYLSDFLSSPDQSTMDIKVKKAERERFIEALNRTTVDLKSEVIKKGSPHTLRLTKTMASYQRALADWEDDTALLDALNRLISSYK